MNFLADAKRTVARAAGPKTEAAAARAAAPKRAPAPARKGIAMANDDFNPVDEYIASQPETAQPVLERVRSTIRKAVPEAEEVISYKIPTYKLRGFPVLYLAGWKRHYSLYPCTGDLVAAFQDELAPYEVNNKGTIRFPLSRPVPVKLIERIAKFRAKEAARREKAKSAAPKNRQGRLAGSF
jgi:uncharacterized protein YdhG (YjbR/CyaY superfamily)